MSITQDARTDFLAHIAQFAAALTKIGSEPKDPILEQDGVHLLYASRSVTDYAIFFGNADPAEFDGALVDVANDHMDNTTSVLTSISNGKGSQQNRASVLALIKLTLDNLNAVQSSIYDYLRAGSSQPVSATTDKAAANDGAPAAKEKGSKKDASNRRKGKNKKN
jgi:hypothetical protein